MTIALIGSYRPICRYYPDYTKINIFNKDEEIFSSLIQDQIQNPLEEQKLAQDIPILKKFTDEISQKVAVQYEENPYPRWKTVDKKESKSIKQTLQDIFQVSVDK